MKYLKTFEELDNKEENKPSNKHRPKVVDPSLTQEPWVQRGYKTKKEWEEARNRHLEDPSNRKK